MPVGLSSPDENRSSFSFLCVLISLIQWKQLVGGWLSIKGGRGVQTSVFSFSMSALVKSSIIISMVIMALNAEAYHGCMMLAEKGFGVQPPEMMFADITCGNASLRRLANCVAGDVEARKSWLSPSSFVLSVSGFYPGKGKR